MKNQKELEMPEGQEEVSVEVGMTVLEAEPVEVATTRYAEESDLVRMAMDKDVDLDKLERIIALQERVTDRNARMAYVSALSSFRAECPQPKRNRENTQFSVTRGGQKVHATYSDLSEIERVARPVAAKFGLTWTWDTRVDADLMHVTCKVQHVDGHSDTATVSMPYESKAGSSPQQKYGSTQTYGMRYSLIAALGITTADEDLDGASGEQAEAITDGQAEYLKKILKDSDADVQKFLGLYGIKSVDEMTQRDFPRAVKDIEERNRKKAAKESTDED